MRHLIRTISPDEYDAAVATCPCSCPLHVMGDRRTGQQLLHDAAADARAPLRAFFAALRADRAREAAFLRRLAELPFPFELRDPFLDSLLAPVPAPAAAAAPAIAPATAPAVPRPLALAGTHQLNADAAAPPEAFLVLRADWALAPLLRRYWALGFRAEDLTAVFDAVPPALRAALCRAIDQARPGP